MAVSEQLFDADVSPIPALNWNCGADVFVGGAGCGVLAGGAGVLVGGRGRGVLVGTITTALGVFVGGVIGVSVGAGVLVGVAVDGVEGVEVSAAVGVNVARLVREARGVAVASALVNTGTAGALQASDASTMQHNIKLH